MRLVRINMRTEKFIHKCLLYRKEKLSVKLARVAQSIDVTSNIAEIISDEPIIFCCGYIKPIICISTGLTESLSDGELRSVLLHEKHHLMNRDPIKHLIVKTLGKILFFVPALDCLGKRYLILSELAADEHATDNFNDKDPLIKSLIKIIDWRHQAISQNSLAVSSFTEALPERINCLSNSGYAPQIEIFSKKLAISSLMMIVIFSSISLFISLDDRVLAQKSTDSCSSDRTSMDKCQMITKTTCIMRETGIRHSCEG